ncbi:energy-coupling factor transporter ATP-binding protein EcfA [Paenibacillus tyrfis]|uniref:ATP-binding cassette domain-containing protein n=1 Tax=Paenibacillus TaxID=44249 RepID=UPI002493B400|nr:ATP-binding cassette domain-containing protein [Paenibacillus tyrfis]GLI09863.1 energy-coupling factor transporter ATP-binding protein EcfA [Paenibacillus tyrfis]GMX60348.1 energy-coupling factor transporter ATPase [Paenibacillus elgii]
MSSSFFIALQEASVKYPTGSGTHIALSNVTLLIEPGEWITVAGPNGSGKSTLAGALLGTCRLTSGRLVRKEPLDIRGVLQHPEAQHIGDTPAEELAFALNDRRLSKEELKLVQKQALLRVGLQLSPDTPLNSLSGGQKQLVNIAAALATAPDMLVLDEPTAMLDPAARELVLRVVRQAHLQGTTVVWITHRQEEAVHASRIVAFQKGEIAFDGAPETFFYGDPATASDSETPCERVGLDPPFVVQTALHLKKKGHDLTARPLSYDDLAKAVNRLCL